MKAQDLSLYVVTDPLLPGKRTLEDVCRDAFASGVRILQLRDKQASTRVLVEQARQLRVLADAFGALFLVNDRLDVALAAAADGVHLGQEDLPLNDARRLLGASATIGISVRTSEEARAAERGGADYIAANLVFATPTKTDIDQPLGLEGVRVLRRACSLPMVAIGGIQAGNAAEVVAAGADGVAVVSAVMAADDVRAECAALLAAVERGRGMRRE